MTQILPRPMLKLSRHLDIQFRSAIPFVMPCWANMSILPLEYIAGRRVQPGGSFYGAQQQNRILVWILLCSLLNFDVIAWKMCTNAECVCLLQRYGHNGNLSITRRVSSACWIIGGPRKYNIASLFNYNLV